MYHISDIKKFLHCERYYFYSKDTNNAFKPYFRFDESIDELLMRFFNIEECFVGERNDVKERFLSNYDNYEWFIHPRVIDGHLRINVPLLHKIGDNVNVYFIYYGTLIKDLDLINYRICDKVLRSNNICVNNYYVVYFNEKYLRKGELELNELFICIDTYKDRRIIDYIKDKEFDYESIISKMDSFVINEKAIRNKYCHQNGECEYHEKCFGKKNIANDSILTLVSSQNKYEMFDNGIKLLKEVDISKLEGNRVQYAQIMASKNGGVFVDRNALRQWLSTIDDDNVSYIDFEWDRYLIPPYDDMRPMDVLCFEFALYYKQDNELKQKTFIGKGDCRKEFTEELIKYIPKQGPILAYNADGAEKIRLTELGTMYPEYKASLDEINNRFIDLATPFIEGLVYDVRMEGNYSLKKLVDICSDYSYKDLDIYDGMEAVFNWRQVDKGVSEKEEAIVEDLKKYCGLDAYGLHLVFTWLKTLLN